MTIVNAKAADAAVTVTATDLHGGRAVFCPNPKMALWSQHPRVFIDVAASGHGQCPYCGTRYQLTGAAPHASGH